MTALAGILHANAKRSLFALIAAAVVAPLPAHAESMKEAFTSAYLFNPILKSARSGVRATDEYVALAKSTHRPTISGQIRGGYEDQWVSTGALSDGGYKNWPKAYTVTARQPVFRGFRTVNAVSGAEASVEAARENLRYTEATVFLQTATAYVNTFRDMTILKVYQYNQTVLEQQLKAAEDRFKVGEVTKTDVAQAQAAVAAATSQVNIARQNLDSDRAVYQQYVGRPPMGVTEPTVPAHLMPRTLDEAVKIADAENPQILAAVFQERAQEYQVKQLKGQLLPEVNLEATYTHGVTPQAGVRRTDDTTVMGVVTMPLYEGGAISAQIRQAKETQSQYRQQIDATREQVRAQVATAWAFYTNGRASTKSAQAQVDANRIALQGVIDEEKVGQRTILDTLNARNVLQQSEVTLQTAKHDLVAGAYSVLASVGRLTAYDLQLQVDLYDPTQNYRRVKDKWYGWETSVESREDPVVAPVADPGVTPGQRRGDGPAFKRDRW